jgi:hypothetical protein
MNGGLKGKTMKFIVINNKRFDLDSNADVRAAQASMTAAGVDSTPIFDLCDDSLNDAGETGDTLDSEFEEKAWALAKALDCSILSNIGYDGRGFGPDVWTSDDEPGEYWVLDDSEREEAINNYLDSILEESVLSEIPEAYRDYFDKNAWKEDQVKEIEAGEGYGGPLASYDGHEREACIDGTYYYVYRIG